MGNEANTSKISKAERMLKALTAFNRKERYYVVQTAITGTPPELCNKFRTSLKKELGIEIPSDAYVAIDYHLDWISAAYWLTREGKSPESGSAKNDLLDNYPNARSSPVIAGTQEDVDLLVAFVKDDKLVLILVEAKATSQWKDKQIRSKAGRLSAILKGWNRLRPQFLEPRFLLLGPELKDDGKPSLKETTVSECPDWFRGNDDTIPYLNMSPDPELFFPTRTRKIKEGEYEKWQIKKEMTFKPSGKPKSSK